MEIRRYASNSADMLTSGTSGRLITTSTWLKVAQFLKDDNTQTEETHNYPFPEDDPEIRSSATTLAPNKGYPGAERFTRFSTCMVNFKTSPGESHTQGKKNQAEKI